MPVGTIDDRHSRPTTTLAADELRRLVQEDETPARRPRSSDSMIRERLDTPTTQMPAMALDELLATEPRTSPAVIARGMRHDTVTDPGARPTSALEPETAAALAAERTAQELEAATPTAMMPPITRPTAPRSRADLAIVIATVAVLALTLITLLRA